MVDLLEMDRLKGSGSMEQRLASLEEQVGFGPGPVISGAQTRWAWLVALQCGGFENEHTGEPPGGGGGDGRAPVTNGTGASFSSGKSPQVLAELRGTALGGGPTCQSEEQTSSPPLSSSDCPLSRLLSSVPEPGRDSPWCPQHSWHRPAGFRATWGAGGRGVGLRVGRC